MEEHSEEPLANPWTDPQKDPKSYIILMHKGKWSEILPVEYFSTLDRRWIKKINAPG